jgi:hypothetical protein
MTEIPNLGGVHLEPKQGNPEAPVNSLHDLHATSNNDPFDIDTTTGTPFIIGTTDFQENVLFRFIGTPSAGVTIKFPDDSGNRNRLVAVENACGQTATIDTVTGVDTSSTIDFLDAKTGLVAMRGRELTQIGAQGP